MSYDRPESATKSASVSAIMSTANAKQMRDRASRLFAIVLQARERGSPDYADELEEMANEMLAHAEAIDRVAAGFSPAASRAAERGVAHRRQPPQASDEESE
jgi:hypothetical protein